MESSAESDNFVDDEQVPRRRRPSKNGCLNWWNQSYRHQQIIYRFIKSYRFRVLVIFLVIFDEVLLISEIFLDSYKIQTECEIYDPHFKKDYYEMMKDRIEFIMELAHFSSITILIFFVIELIIRIYVSGREFWNWRRKKMEYLDAFIVITSLLIDLYLLRENRILGKKLLMFAFRLWRFVRIISSVAQGVHDGHMKHKRRLNRQYMIAVRQLVDLLIQKTAHIEYHDGHLTAVIEQFRQIDNHCQTSFDVLEKNHTLTSSAVVAQFVDALSKLNQMPNQEFLSVIFTKSSEV